MEKNRSCNSSEGMSAVVEWCPLCERKGFKTPARFFQINFHEALFSCSRAQCDFPFATEYIPVFIKRDFNNMNDPNYTPVVTVADILNTGARGAHISTSPKRSPDIQPSNVERDSSAGITEARETTITVKGHLKFSSSGAKKKAQEQIAQIMGDIPFVSDSCQSDSEEHIPEVSEKAATPTMSEFDRFVFSIPEITISKLRPTKRRTYKLRKRKCTRKKTSKTNKSGDSVADTHSSTRGRKRNCNNRSSVTSDRSTADANLVMTEQTSFCNNDILNGYNESDFNVNNVLSVQGSTECNNTSQSDNAGANLNQNDVCENKQVGCENVIELSRGWNLINFPENIVCADSSTDSASCDLNTDLNKAVTRYQNVPNQNGAKSNCCDHEGYEVSIYSNVLTPKADLEEPCGFLTSENCDETLFAGIESVKQPCQNYHSVSRDNCDRSESRGPLEEVGDSVSTAISRIELKRNTIVSIQNPSIPKATEIKPLSLLENESDIVNFVCCENNCETPSACIEDLQALSELVIKREEQIVLASDI